MSDEMDSVDRMLQAAMGARAEHVSMIDVAAVAIGRARVQQERVARLARISFWTRMSGVAAGVLITLIAAAGYWYWPASTATDVTDTTSTTASSIDLTTVGIAAFVVTLVVVVLLTVMTPERQTLRLTPV